jgi:hypothetical protein
MIDGCLLLLIVGIVVRWLIVGRRFMIDERLLWSIVCDRFMMGRRLIFLIVKIVGRLLVVGCRFRMDGGSFRIVGAK